MFKRLFNAGLLLTISLVCLAILDVLVFPPSGLPTRLLLIQDVPVLWIGTAAAVVLRLGLGLSGLFATPLRAIATSVFTPAAKLADRRLVIVSVLASACGLLACVGAQVVCDNYALSMDEFLANFDAAFLGRLQPMAPIAANWRPYIDALQPIFVIHAGNAAYWRSCYLPVNAALRGLAGDAGAQALVSPLLAAISIVAVFGVARRIWPQKPQIGLAAAFMLASSSQFLITAMTPYSMTAHLAFNLVWLWLFLRGDRLGNAGAMLVGFLACGLHQLIFHLLFVAPFILQLWGERRWRTAMLYALTYGLISIFWIEYLRLAPAYFGVATPLTAQLGPGGFVKSTIHSFGTFGPSSADYTIKNFIRFVTWQNVITIPLLCMGVIAAFRAKGTLRSLLLGIALTAGAVTIILAYQGHGWGYRYLHGLLGSVCLLAAWQWDRLSGALTAEQRPLAQLTFLGAGLVSLLVLLPVRAWQVHDFIHPYASAEGSIRHASSDVVLVDDSGVFYGSDLVRNDPYLRNRPIVLRLRSLGLDQVQALCADHTISVFDVQDAARFGIPHSTMLETPNAMAIRALVETGRCGRPLPSGRRG